MTGKEQNYQMAFYRVQGIVDRLFKGDRIDNDTLIQTIEFFMINTEQYIRELKEKEKKI